MARNQNYVSLCIAEGIAETGRVGWRTIADQVGRRGMMLESVPAEQQTIIYTGREPRVGEVAMYDWSETRKTASGDMDIRDVGNENPKPIEIIDLMDFKHAKLEDTHFIRNILKNGFSLPEFTYQSFISQQTVIAIRLNSRTYGEVALLFTDKSKLKAERNPATSGWTCRIERIPDDPNRFMGHIDVVNIGKDTVFYKYKTATSGREFAARTPDVVAKFLPYTDAEMAPLVWKRLTVMAAKSHTLASGRKLTKAEATELYNFQLKNLQDENTMIELLRVDNADTARKYAEGILRLLQTTNDVMEKNDSILHDVCQLLYQDETLHDQITAQIRDKWLADNEAETAKHNATIQTLLDDISLEEKRVNGLRADAKKLEDAIQRLDIEKAAKEAAIDSVAANLSSHIENYRLDLAQLIADTGIPTGSMPMVIPCSKIATEKPTPLALIQNLADMLASPDEARGAAEYIERMLSLGFHLAVPGEYAKPIADTIAIAHSGKTPTTVIRADSDCNTNTLFHTIMSAPTPVILVEGVLGCDEDFKTLALARHCTGKILIFSLDDAMNADKISSTVFSRIALIDNLTFKAVTPVVNKRLDKPLPVPSGIIMNRTLPHTGHKNIDVFFEAQKERMGLN